MDQNKCNCDTKIDFKKLKCGILDTYDHMKSDKKGFHNEKIFINYFELSSVSIFLLIMLIMNLLVIDGVFMGPQ